MFFGNIQVCHKNALFFFLGENNVSVNVYTRIIYDYTLPVSLLILVMLLSGWICVRVIWTCVNDQNLKSKLITCFNPRTRTPQYYYNYSYLCLFCPGLCFEAYCTDRKWEGCEILYWTFVSFKEDLYSVFCFVLNTLALIPG